MTPCDTALTTVRGTKLTGVTDPQPNTQAAPTLPSQSQRVLGALRGTALASSLARDAHGLDPQAPGAESALQLFILDGLMDAIEWAAAGVGADDTACLWLGALRWVKASQGRVPDGAPEPPTRWISAAVGSLEGATGGDAQNLAGLQSPEMSQPRRPWNRRAATVPELASTDGPGVLARGAALGLLEYALEEDVRRLASSAAAFSHGSPAAHEAAADAASVMYAVPQGLPAVREALSAVLGREFEPTSGSRCALRRALESVESILGDRDGASDLRPDLAWDAVSRLAAQGDEGAAMYAGALVGALVGSSELPATAVREDAAVLEMARRFLDAVG